jgi:NAD(P)-dependent dehydrogenase (short-subunit alcohol dehydrogenase family)
VRETADTITTRHPDVKVRLLELDLGSLAPVHQAAEAVQSWDDVPKIDVLVNNAGVMDVEYARSDAGVEMTLAANHLGPFLFTNLVMNKLLAADKPWAVMLGSVSDRLPGCQPGYRHGQAVGNQHCRSEEVVGPE